MKFILEFRSSKYRFCLFGAVFERNKPDFQFLDATRTSIAFIPPQNHKDGSALKLWGYDRIAHLPKKPTKRQIKKAIK
jgi:hypothetical protein